VARVASGALTFSAEPPPRHVILHLAHRDRVERLAAKEHLQIRHAATQAFPRVRLLAVFAASPVDERIRCVAERHNLNPELITFPLRDHFPSRGFLQKRGGPIAFGGGQFGVARPILACCVELVVPLAASPSESHWSPVSCCRSTSECPPRNI